MKKAGTREGGAMKMASANDSVFGAVRRFFGACVAIVALAMIVFYFVARTEWARVTAEERLSQRLGLDVSVEGTSIGWPYALVVSRVVSAEAYSEGEPWLEVESLRIGLGLTLAWRIGVDRATLRIPAHDDDVKIPETLRRLMSLDLTDVQALTRLTAPLPKRLSFSLENSRMEWLGHASHPVASARGVAFEFSPVQIPSRQLRYHALRIYDYERNGMPTLQDYRREWLAGAQLGIVDLVPEIRLSVRTDDRPSVAAGVVSKDPTQVIAREDGPESDKEEPAPSAPPLMKRERQEHL